MQLNQYQNEAMRTAIYPLDRALEYTVLGLVSEAGEVAGKVKKIIRDKGGKLASEDIFAVADELGDVLWYVAEAARALDVQLDYVAQRNLDKLESRARRGQIQGSGDTR